MNWDRLQPKRASARPFEQPLLSLVLLGAVAMIGIVVGALLTPRQTRVSRHHWKR